MLKKEGRRRRRVVGVIMRGAEEGDNHRLNRPCSSCYPCLLGSMLRLTPLTLSPLSLGWFCLVCYTFICISIVKTLEKEPKRVCCMTLVLGDSSIEVQTQKNWYNTGTRWDSFLTQRGQKFDPLPVWSWIPACAKCH